MELELLEDGLLVEVVVNAECVASGADPRDEEDERVFKDFTLGAELTVILLLVLLDHLGHIFS